MYRVEQVRVNKFHVYIDLKTRVGKKRKMELIVRLRTLIRERLNSDEINIDISFCEIKLLETGKNTVFVNKCKI